MGKFDIFDVCSIHGKYNFTAKELQTLETNDKFYTNDILNKAEIWIDYKKIIG
jgi:hypothetical protein